MSDRGGRGRNGTAAVRHGGVREGGGGRARFFRRRERGDTLGAGRESKLARGGRARATDLAVERLAARRLPNRRGCQGRAALAARRGGGRRRRSLTASAIWKRVRQAFDGGVCRRQPSAEEPAAWARVLPGGRKPAQTGLKRGPSALMPALTCALWAGTNRGPPMKITRRGGLAFVRCRFFSPAPCKPRRQAPGPAHGAARGAARIQHQISIAGRRVVTANTGRVDAATRSKVTLKRVIYREQRETHAHQEPAGRRRSRRCTTHRAMLSDGHLTPAVGVTSPRFSACARRSTPRTCGARPRLDNTAQSFPLCSHGGRNLRSGVEPRLEGAHAVHAGPP